MENSIKEMRDKKAAGNDDVTGDVLKFFGEDLFRLTTRLIKNMHETGKWPKDLIDVKMIVWKKKPKATIYLVFRTISLIAHTASIVTKILRRIEKKIEEDLGQDQFAFRRNKGSRSAIRTLKMT